VGLILALILIGVGLYWYNSHLQQSSTS
jgi:hypothetical protein